MSMRTTCSLGGSSAAGTSMPVALTKGLIRGVRSTFGVRRYGLDSVEIDLGAAIGLEFQLQLCWRTHRTALRHQLNLWAARHAARGNRDCALWRR